MSGHSKEKIESMYTCAPLTKLSDEEKAGLEYIRGYVLHDLHTKHASKSLESERAISILKAGKLADQNAIECQKLTSSLYRGGLWAVSKNAQSIFERTEHYFRDATSRTNVQMLVLYQDLFMMLKLSHTIQCFPILKLIINSSVAKDVLHNIIQLYVKVRSFFFLQKILCTNRRLD